MKRPISLAAIALALVCLTLPLHAEAWKSLPLMDGNCLSKMSKDPDAHPRSCALECAKSGYGVIAGGKFLKFDEEGNRKALAAIKQSAKKDHLRASVQGTLKGDVITVASVSIE